jgi:hypothetical protein
LGFTSDFEAQAPGGDLRSLAVHDDGTGPQLYVGGEFSYIIGYLPFSSRNIARWDGTNWSRVGWGVDYYDPFDQPPNIGVNALASFGSTLFVGGTFNRYYSEQAQDWVPCGGLLRWDGAQYTDVSGQALVNRVRGLIEYDDGTGPALYTAFSSTGHVVRFDGNTWSTVGAAFVGPLPFYPSTLYQFAVVSTEVGPRLFMTGSFRGIVGSDGQTVLPLEGFASWDGAQWNPVPSPMYLADSPSRIAGFDDGNGDAFIYSDRHTIWRYRGGVWDVVLPDLEYNNIANLVAYDDGNGSRLYAFGGRIHLPGMPPNQYARMARFDGQTWTALGPVSTGSSYESYPETSAVYDFGEGPDLYMTVDFGYSLDLAGQHPIGLTRYRGVYRDVAPVCGGDGSLVPCPCGSSLFSNGRGCPNSAAPLGALLTGRGMPPTDTLAFEASSMPPNAVCVYIQATGYDYSPSFLGDGVRCATGTSLRLNVQTAQNGITSLPNAGGPSVRELVNMRGDPLPAGAVRYYQAWYRDSNPAFCASGGLFNVTNGVRVVW